MNINTIVSEFNTVEQEKSYDLWFRCKVERSLADTRPAIPHDEAMARVKTALEKGKLKHAQRYLVA